MLYLASGVRLLCSLTNQNLVFIQFENAHKRLLWYLYVTNLSHSLLSFLLFFKKLLLTGNITAVTFRKYVFANSFYGFTSDNLASDGCLNWNLE